MSGILKVPRSKQAHEGALWCYEVLTPYYESGGDGYLEPPEWGCDYRMVYAKTARRAKSLAVKSWLRFGRTRYGCWPTRFLKTIRKHSNLGSQWVCDNVADNTPPWKGVKVSRYPTVEWIEENQPE